MSQAAHSPQHHVLEAEALLEEAKDKIDRGYHESGTAYVALAYAHLGVGKEIQRYGL